MAQNTPHGVHPYPIILEPILMEKVWGGSRLARLGKKVPAGRMVGESWELCDFGATSVSGGGGSAARSLIANGPLAGLTIHDALEFWGAGLLGDASPTAEGNVPLLIKFLDARENLSVQVHPSRAYAHGNPKAHLKTECWIILDAEPGSVIYKGIRPGVTPEAFGRHIVEGTVVDDMMAFPAVVGECHNLPSGTCHALGAGVLVAEVQTPSDTTFRVHDWGRVGRELHIEQALACIEFGPAPAATRFAGGEGSARLVTTEYFTVDRVRTAGVINAGGGMSAWMVLDGAGRVEFGDVGIEVTMGQTFVVPAACAADARIAARGMIDVLCARVV
ncbi:MAG TPA: type I phosphomannose isomerase catalytic subunit [Phycisphaerales bacterium]|nr:type I phosphomannose isomerase catalytic subunit [Phycisphaerales bacterium]